MEMEAEGRKSGLTLFTPLGRDDGKQTSQYAHRKERAAHVVGCLLRSCDYLFTADVSVLLGVCPSLYWHLGKSGQTANSLVLAVEPSCGQGLRGQGAGAGPFARLTRG